MTRIKNHERPAPLPKKEKPRIYPVSNHDRMQKKEKKVMKEGVFFVHEKENWLIG